MKTWYRSRWRIFTHTWRKTRTATSLSVEYEHPSVTGARVAILWPTFSGVKIDFILISCPKGGKVPMGRDRAGTILRGENEIVDSDLCKHSPPWHGGAFLHFAVNGDYVQSVPCPWQRIITLLCCSRCVSVWWGEEYDGIVNDLITAIIVFNGDRFCSFIWLDDVRRFSAVICRWKSGVWKRC